MNNLDAIMVLNAGSSSLKFKIFSKDSLDVITSGQITGIGTNKTKLKIKDKNDVSIKEEQIDASMPRDDILIYLLDVLNQLFKNINIVIAGHRVVHGGVKYKAPTLITQEVIDNLKNIIHLTPIHLPHNIRPMEVLKNKFPSLTQVACFDTAFHSTNPEYTKYYAIPKKLIDEDQVMRYGFHGLSYEYMSYYLKENHPELHKGKVVVCHLGAGASLAALKEGKSFATTMGFTPLDGLVMGSRTGEIDPGILLFLMNHKGYSTKDLEDLVYYKSGILGLSEESSDFYSIETSEKESSKIAWKVFVTSVIKHVGSLVALMNGVDAIIFTAGVGENSNTLREQVCENLKYLGIEISKQANKDSKIIISSENSKAKVFVIPTQEELMIAKHSVALSK